MKRFTYIGIISGAFISYIIISAIYNRFSPFFLEPFWSLIIIFFYGFLLVARWHRMNPKDPLIYFIFGFIIGLSTLIPFWNIIFALWGSINFMIGIFNPEGLSFGQSDLEWEKLRQHRRQVRKRKKLIKTLLSISKRIRISDFWKVLGLEASNFKSEFDQWIKKYKIYLEGDFMILPDFFTSSDAKDFMKKIDNSYQSWLSSESKKYKKY